MYTQTSAQIYNHSSGFKTSAPAGAKYWVNGRDGGIVLSQDADTWRCLYIVAGFFETPDDLWQALFFVTALLKGVGYTLYVRADGLPELALDVYIRFGFQPIEAGSRWLWLEV